MLPAMGGYWAFPGGLPSSTAFVSNPEGAIRDMTEHDTNHTRDVGPDDSRLAWYEEWGKTESYRKIIMEVLKARLELSWPYNYKALMILAKMPDPAIVTLHEQLGKLSEAADSVVGAEHIKKIAKPIFERSVKEKKKKEDEEAKKKQEAIAAMWGGLWANDGYTAPAIATNGWAGWPYPYPMPPGVAAQMMADWKGKGLEGWQPAPITTLPQHYPCSRTGFYGIRQEEEANKMKEKPAAVHVSLGAGKNKSIRKSVTFSLPEVYAKAEKDLAARNW